MNRPAFLLVAASMTVLVFSFHASAQQDDDGEARVTIRVNGGEPIRVIPIRVMNIDGGTASASVVVSEVVNGEGGEPVTVMWKGANSCNSMETTPPE